MAFINLIDIYKVHDISGTCLCTDDRTVNIADNMHYFQSLYCGMVGGRHQ